MISVVALLAAVGGGTFAIASSTKKVVNKQITKRAPGLSVLHAKSAENTTNGITWASTRECLRDTPGMGAGE